MQAVVEAEVLVIVVVIEVDVKFNRIIIWNLRQL